MTDNETTWSYFTWNAKVPSVTSLNDGFTLLGELGWELATSMSTVKSLLNVTGNDLIFVFKKRGTGHVVDKTISDRLGWYSVKGNPSPPTEGESTNYWGPKY